MNDLPATNQITTLASVTVTGRGQAIARKRILYLVADEVDKFPVELAAPGYFLIGKQPIRTLRPAVGVGITPASAAHGGIVTG